MLVEELETMGAKEIIYDKEHCYVYASIPASKDCEDASVLGFIAHMDTSPAVTDTNVNPRVVDKARLSFMGLPCPNLCTGGENYHGRYEYACVQSMKKTTELLIRIAEKYRHIPKKLEK